MSSEKSYFRALSELSREIGTTEDQSKMLHLIVSTAVKTLNAKAAVIFRRDDDSEDSIQNAAVAQLGLSKKYIHAGPAHAVKISPQLLKDGYMYFRDATTDKRLTNRKAKKAEGIGSILSVPVMDKNRMLGILSLYTKSIRKFTKDEIDFLSILAEQGGSAIEIAHLIRRLRNNTKIFLKLAASISESLDVKTILQAMTQDMVESLDLKAASVRLLDDDKRTLKSVASFGLSEKYMNKGPILADKNIAEALKGKTIAIQNVFKDTGIQYKKEKKAEGIVSMLYVPIRAKDNVIGVLIVYSGRQRTFTEDEIQLVTALAYQGGLAIHNACEYMVMQDDIKDLKENIWSHKSWF
ncbi:MAG TPA: GAF domain-containing protein [Smithellaceae bacterium]|nr:GAF domain-containing protein [Smithellaceae bacterium]HPE06453.1 GAF domain-containing protein [Smithellaceae bacterium]HRY37425.1 GAF domain-containing protein [Smithellaceae bacterium]